jgi:SAM-dependent methyltransferase
MSLIESLHTGYVHRRRVDVLARHLARLLPRDASVLDVGCGDGRLAGQISKIRCDMDISGIDVLCRPETQIPVREFDGATIPYPDKSFEAVLFVDVLHHTVDPMILLREARRVARTAIVIKDHSLCGLLALPTLRFMDEVGNRRHGVALPYNYWTPKQWQRAVQELGLSAVVWKKDLNLYPAPARWLFDRSLHFIALLAIP